jgi:hypothetical protein
MEQPIYETFSNGEFIVNYVRLVSRLSSATVMSEMTLRLEDNYKVPAYENNKYTIINNGIYYNYVKTAKLEFSPFEFDVTWIPHSKTIRGDHVFLMKKFVRSNPTSYNRDVLQSQNSQQNANRSMTSNTSSFRIIPSSQED